MIEDENNQEQMNQNLPTDPKKHLSWKIWVPLLIVVAILAGYLVLKWYSDYWCNSLVVDCGGPPILNDSVDDISTWQTYRNEEYGFEVMYPEDWKLTASVLSSGDNFDGLFLEKNDSKILILPNGGADHGLPRFEPEEKQELIGGSSISRTWKIEGNEGESILTLYHITDPPQSWSKCINNYNACNRIEVESSSSELNSIDQILSTFKFIN